MSRLSSGPTRALGAVALAFVASSAFGGGPVVVPTSEGQIGATPGPVDRVLGPIRFESIRGQAGEVVLGGLSVFGGALPPPPEVFFLEDRFHATPDPTQVGGTSSLFANIDRVAPDSAWSRNAAGDGDFVAFSFAVDGSLPQTLTVRIATFDETGSSLVEIPVASDLPTFVFPDPAFARTGVEVDDQGRVTVVYTEFVAGTPQARALRVNATSGTLVTADFLINDVNSEPSVALLDPAGNRLVVATTDLASPVAGVEGNIIDFTGPSPVVGTPLAINSTSGLVDFNPAVAADSATGRFTVVWEKIVDIPGDPVNVFARRFDAMGNPIGGEFQVNTTSANAQGQPAVAYGPGGLSAIVWASDPIAPMAPDDLDVFFQAYDAMGNPIGGELQVNTFTDDIQDRPAVRFLPDLDEHGRPQVAVVWRDAGSPDGGQPRGTGISYRCFSIDGVAGASQAEIFSDGFESGDTSSWSATRPE